ncbi:hypothetical protein [Bacillus sp. OK048]|uniref:hypothetical protein n=1 Tax=Bacillus sp. OK048 TaxID=1882761 RepID=UPI00087E24D9|nr:hypothetical protein [Bacillus sp. OK048]SDM19151.1 hypothetical protein SAMN05443253_102241 [Bacillus sp. OK048]
MTKRFGIDIDGTVTCPSALVPFINKGFGLNLTIADIKDYDLNKAVKVSEEKFSKWFIENEPIMYEESPLAEGADKILKQWQIDHELFFISARGSHLLENTKKWFSKQGLSYNHIELIGSHDKVSSAKHYQVDIFLEDKHDNAVMIHEECDIPVLLFNTPYNQDPIPKGVIRVNNWFEANHWVKNWLG